MTLARVITLGTTPLEIGGLAIVTTGLSKGTVVQLVKQTRAPVATWGQGLHAMQPSGPLWVVDRVLRWELKGKIYKGSVAPWTALRALTVR